MLTENEILMSIQETTLAFFNEDLHLQIIPDQQKDEVFPLEMRQQYYFIFQTLFQSNLISNDLKLIIQHYLHNFFSEYSDFYPLWSNLNISNTQHNIKLIENKMNDLIYYSENHTKYNNGILHDLLNFKHLYFQNVIAAEYLIDLERIDDLETFCMFFVCTMTNVHGYTTKFIMFFRIFFLNVCIQVIIQNFQE